MKDCSACQQPTCAEIINFGDLPICHHFLKDSETEGTHPAALGQCAFCGLVQMMNPIPPAKLVPRFDWITYNEPEAHLDAVVDMKFFFTRKTLLIKYSYAFIVMPGGLGTMDELFEALTLIQTGKIKEFPVILMGTEYWQPVVTTLLKMCGEGMISASDLDLLLVTDSIEAAMQRLREKAITQFNLRRVKLPKPLGVLGEKKV